MNSNQAAGSIPRITNPSPEDFRKDYLLPGKPVVLQGAISDWKALSTWNPEYLVKKVGSREIIVQTSPDGVFGLDPEKGGPRYQEQRMTLAEYADRAYSGKLKDQRVYVQRLNIPTMLPELMEDISYTGYVDEKRIYLINLWFGVAGNVTRLHYDVPNNFLAQVYGKKRLIMYGPDQTKNLYPYNTKAYNMSQVDPDKPDLEKFPRYGRVKRYEVTIEPGDMLFIPAFWWHQVYNLDHAISVNLWWTPRLPQFFVRQVIPNIPDIIREAPSLLARGMRLSS